MTNNRSGASGERVLRSALIITVIIIASKIMGFVREMVFANYFGTTALSDAYTNASTIVNLFILLFSACISSTFIPIYTKTLRNRGKTEANRYTNSVLTLFAFAGVAVSVLGYFFAPLVCELLMPELIPTAQQGTAQYLAELERLNMTAQMAQIMFPTMVFAACTGVFTSLLNANERFVPEQIIGFALSGSVIVACVFFSDSGINAVAYATALTYVIQLLIVLPFLRGIYRFDPRIDGCEGKVAQTFKLALPAVMTMALDEIHHLVDKNVGISLGDGPNTALTYSYRLITMILGVLVVPVTTIMFSKLSQYAAEGRKKKILQTTKQCLEVLALVVVPITVLCMVQSKDIIQFLFYRGAFDEYSLSLTSSAFLFYVVGVMAFAWKNYLVRVFYAIQDTSAPMKIGLVTVVANVVLDVVLAKVMGVGGLTLGTSIAGLLGAVLMLIRLRRRLGSFQFSDTLLQLCKVVVAACVAGAVTMLVSGAVQLAVSSLFVRLAAASAAGLLVYCGMVFLLRVEEVETLREMVKNKLKRR